jgi:hypothetical protein
MTHGLARFRRVVKVLEAHYVGYRRGATAACCNGEPGGDRTHDPRIKSPLLYR